MAVLRMQFSNLLFILFVIGFIANDVNGDCYRPNFTNPYAILLDPDKPTYSYYHIIDFSCIEEHTKFGLPEIIYCEDPFWDIDPSEGLCEAQCNTIDLLDDDIVVMVNGSQQTLVDSRTTAQFSCRDPGQFTGLASALCTNGTFVYSAEPSCLAYCPVYLDDLGVGLYYDIADDPVINETNIFYYRDGDVITYKCSDGYEGPQNRTPSDDDTSTCYDGLWDPPGIPTCMDIDNCASHTCQNGATCVDEIASYKCQCPDGFNGNQCEHVITTVEMTTDIMASPGSTSEPVRKTDDLDVTTMNLTTAPTVPESTTRSDSTASLSSTTSISDTTQTGSVRSTSRDDATEPSLTESKETTASRKTSPTTLQRTEKPPTTSLTCGGECKATQVCNADNECECRPDYYEDEEDSENQCKEPKSFDVTIKITEVNNTNAEYNDELEDPSSPEFKKLEIDVCEPFEEIYDNYLDYIGCRVFEFRNSSIIVNYVLTFVENSTQSTSTVNKTVQEELQNPNGSFTGDYGFDDSSLVVTPLDECSKNIDDCDQYATCINQRENGYTCECREGFDDVGIPKSLPGRECMKPTEPHPTEPEPTDPRITEEPEEPGVEPWKVVVGVTVPIITIIIVGLTCWQYRRLHRTSSKLAVTNAEMIRYDDDRQGSSDPEAIVPGSKTIMNDYGTMLEEEESDFVPDKE